MKVTFTKKAEEQLDEVQQHLRDQFSNETADKFLTDFKDRLEHVKKHPRMFKASPKSNNIRIGYINKFASFLYRVYSKTIRVLLIKQSRKND